MKQAEVLADRGWRKKVCFILMVGGAELGCSLIQYKQFYVHFN